MLFIWYLLEVSRLLRKLEMMMGEAPIPSPLAEKELGSCAIVLINNMAQENCAPIPLGMEYW
jgi:hypothetical protein